jgi:endonuclease YncB( thermonuclease family)
VGEGLDEKRCPVSSDKLRVELVTPEEGKLYTLGLPSSGLATVHGFRAVDGDTFEGAFLIPVVFRVHGINAPERGRPGAAEATQALSALVAGKMMTVRVDGREKYGRTLADVWLGKDAGWLSDDFIKRGLASPYNPK